MTSPRTFVFLVLFSIVGAGGIRAETWPSLEGYVEHCVLIVLCETEASEDGIRHKVKEEWKGVYSPKLFHHEPKEGYIYPHTLHGDEKRAPGELTIFFFTTGNHPTWTQGKLLGHSTFFPVEDGKLVYASTSWGMRKEYTLEAFRKEVARHVRAQYVETVQRKIVGDEVKNVSRAE